MDGLDARLPCVEPVLLGGLLEIRERLLRLLPLFRVVLIFWSHCKHRQPAIQ
jgi:hypothetical protein